MNRAMKNNLLPVAQEGFFPISVAFVTSCIFFLFDFELLFLLSFASFIALLFIFRNPERELPSFEKASLLSPADGRVVSIEELETPHNSLYAYKVVVESTLAHVAILRSPANVTLKSVTTYKGTRTSRESKLFSDLNECSKLTFTTDEDNSFCIEHRLKRSCVPLLVDGIAGEKFTQTSRYGVMFNGVTTLYLPSNFRFNLKVGEELKAAESLIGYFS